MYCAGIVASTMYNAWRAKGERPLSAKDFLPQEELSEEEIERQALAFLESLSNLSAAEKAHKELLLKN